jgi:hypothetical protein
VIERLFAALPRGGAGARRLQCSFFSATLHDEVGAMRQQQWCETQMEEWLLPSFLPPLESPTAARAARRVRARRHL